MKKYLSSIHAMFMYVSLKKACICAILSNGFFSTLKYHLSFMLQQLKKKKREEKFEDFFHTWQIWHQSIEGKMLEKVSLMKFAGRCCLRTDTLINLFFFVRKAQNYCMKLEKINKFHAAHKHKKKKNRVTHSKSSHEWDFLAHKKK